MSVNDAIILAAGKGSRMKKNNKDLIKPLVEVDDKLLIGYTIEALRNAGVENIHVIESVNESMRMLSALYKDVNFKFYTHDNNNAALVALKLLEKKIKDNFILADCDIVGEVSELTRMIGDNVGRMNSLDGLVAASINPTFVNNRYLEIDGDRVVGFDKSGNSNNMHGGFMYMFNPVFYEYLNSNMGYNDMANILDGYFRNYSVGAMIVDDIWDIDEESEIRESESLLKVKRLNKNVIN